MEIYNKNPIVFNDSDGSDINSNDFNPMSDKKDSEWYKYWTNIYIGAFSNDNWVMEEKLYRVYRGIRTEEDMQDIRETFGGALPVPDVPHIPLIERYINHIVSVSTVRPLVYNISTTDVDAVREADKLKIKEVSQEVTQMITQSISKEMEKPEDKQRINDELQQNIKKAVSKLSNFKIVQERIASKFMELAIGRMELKQKWTTAILDKLITGKQYYKCKLNRMGELPDYEVINPKEIAFPLENVDSLNECSFVVHRKYLSIQEIYVLYGHLLTDKDITELNKYKILYANNQWDSFSPVVEEGTGYFGSSSASLLEVYEVEWKVNKKIAIKDIGDEGAVSTLKSKDGVLEKEKEVKYRYYQELHTCTRIQTNIFVKYGVVANARRDSNNISRVYLSFNGRLYNNRNTPPMSLIKELKDLQDRYDILWYKMFELILLSGIKGVNIIKELMPENMTIDEWMYNRKLGLSQFSISGEGAERLIGQIGQAITPFDDSLAPNSVQALVLAMQTIEKTVGDICGVPPQALGQTQQYETKANTETSIAQGTIILEVFHKDHSEYIRQSLNDILHYTKISMREGTLKDYILTEEEQKLNIIGWNFIDYGIEIVDGYTEEKNLKEVKSVLSELVKAQVINADTLIKGMVSKSTNEVSQIIDDAVKEMKETQQKNAQSQQQAEQEKLKAEMQIKQEELKIKQQELQAKIEQDKNKLVLEKEVAQQENDIKDRLAIVEERYVEIEQQKTNNDIASEENKKAESRTGRNKK